MHIIKTVLITLSFTLITFCFASAEDNSKHTKIVELIKLSGMEESFQDQIQQLKQQNSNMSTEMINSIKNETPSKSDAFYDEMQKEMVIFLKNMDSHLDASKLANQYGQHLSKYLTEEEIDELNRFYRSPIGVKSVAAYKQATIEWSKDFFSEYQDNCLKELKIFKAKIDTIASKYLAQP